MGVAGLKSGVKLWGTKTNSIFYCNYLDSNERRKPVKLSKDGNSRLPWIDLL
jgi:hypothetical protein